MSTIAPLTIAEGVIMPAVAFGTWPLTGADAAKAVREAIEAGYRHIDTAQFYGNEDAVGEGIAASGVDRQDLFVTTKLTNEYMSREGVSRGLEASLTRMGLDYLDLFLVHWPNPALNRLAETSEGLSVLAQGDKLRAWGLSNTTPELLAPVVAAGLVPAVNQIQIDPEHQLAAWCEANAAAGTTTVAYSPLGRGVSLSGELVAGIAASVGRTPAQVILRWHLQHGRGVVPRSANPRRRAQNLDVAGFELSAEQMSAIDALDTGEGPRLHPDEYAH